MIVIATKNEILAAELKTELAKQRISFEIIDPADDDILTKLYRANVSAAVLDATLPNLPRGASTDFLNGLGRRIPVVVIHDESVYDTNKAQVRFAAELSDAVTVV